ncbi:MAG: helix-turn-helix domain-containing protein [Lachnospiraceae bacterium]|nr:helix-turn-helix domain-containing protein [Lachnospiraceae bacterium]
MDVFQDITVEDLNPSIWWCSRVRESRNEQEHVHPNNLELAFILAGQGQYKVDGKIYDVKQGDMIICNPGVKHQSIITDPDNPTLEFICGFSDVHFADMQKDTIELPDGEACLTFSSEIRREISRCCYEIIEENYSIQPGRYYIIKAQIVKMLVLIFRTIKGDAPVEQEATSFESYSRTYVVNKIIKYLNDNYDKKISLDQIASNMYLSPVYISKMFKEKTGDSPINYLIRIRLEKAKEMLESDTNESIKQIAANVGYDDVYHFSKLFKKYYGISPLNFKRSN